MFLYLSVSSFKCWLCRTNDTNPASFTECNAMREEQKCGTKFQPACGIFTYRSKVSGVLIHAKSCVHEKDCGSGTECRLQCCDQELCNYQEEFSPTTAPQDTGDDQEEDCSWIESV